MVGLSGGVDSSVAAILLKQQGYKVIGAHMIVHQLQQEATQKAKEITKSLQIPFYQFNLIEEFRNTVGCYIQSEYLNGRTPNPCAICNKEIKFGKFLQAIENEIGHFDFFATGHYAKKIVLPNGRLSVQKGEDKNKDQAYFLSRLSQTQLKKIIFPLYQLKKDEVRSIAAQHNLAVATSKESQDLCIGSYLDQIQGSSGEGDFIQESTARIVGRHKGIEHYTIGQKRGLYITVGYPLYVTKIDVKNNIVYVDKEDKLYSTEMKINNINWIGVENPPLPWNGEIKIRYRDEGTMATLCEFVVDDKSNNSSATVLFKSPTRAITPGQLAVAYDNEGNLAFSGFIESTFNKTIE